MREQDYTCFFNNSIMNEVIMDPVTVTLIVSLISTVCGAIVSCIYKHINTRAETTHEAGLIITREIVDESQPTTQSNELELRDKLLPGNHQHNGHVRNNKTTIALNFSDASNIQLMSLLKDAGDLAPQPDANVGVSVQVPALRSIHHAPHHSKDYVHSSRHVKKSSAEDSRDEFTKATNAIHRAIDHDQKALESREQLFADALKLMELINAGEHQYREHHPNRSNSVYNLEDSELSGSEQSSGDEYVS